MDKGATGAGVLKRKARWNHQGENGLQWKANKRIMMMKITRGLVDMVAELCPELYGPYVQSMRRTGKCFTYK
jgi:hypothetical protein